MCGIFSAFNPQCLDQKSVALYKLATEKVKHRGPDNIDYFVDELCFLGHTRLSILDPGQASNQPFVFKNFVITYNGEVFNYRELRTELEELGHTFDTDSDTEVVIKSFAEWKYDCFSRFNGMWALVIYDRSNGELVVSRDRFGQKPLFIAKSGQDVFFASEFQQLVNIVDRAIDYELIQMFLKEGTYEGQGRTFLSSVQEFPKAHYLVINRNGKWESQQYWHYWVGEIMPTNSRTIEEFNDLLSDSVRIRLRSDVPLGLLVSGGVDSTLIANFTRDHLGNEKVIPAYTFSSQDADDECFFAKGVSDLLDLKLNIQRPEQIPSRYKSKLSDIVQHLGRGHSSPAVVPVDCLYEAISKNGIRVALDGQGADELLAGYKNYHMLVIPWYIFRGEFKQAWLTFLDQIRFGFFASILFFLRNKLPPLLRKIMRLIYGYEKLFKIYNGPKPDRFVPIKTRGKNKNLLNRYLIWHHQLGLENLLYYGDIVAMRNSVENRSPFMDHRLVDFAFRYDDKLKLNNAIDKYVLRMSESYHLFSDFLERNKVGFSSTITPKTKDLMINDLQNSPILEWPIFSTKMRGFVKSEAILKHKYERILFRLYQVHLWNEIFIEQNHK